VIFGIFPRQLLRMGHSLRDSAEHDCIRRFLDQQVSPSGQSEPPAQFSWQDHPAIRGDFDLKCHTSLIFQYVTLSELMSECNPHVMELA
jgi:hypothetical protein